MLSARSGWCTSQKWEQTERSSRVQPVDGPKKSRYEAMDLDTPNTTETAATDKASDSAPDEADARAATRESADAEVSAEQRQSIPQENQPNPYHRKAEKEKLYPPPMNK
ncbi:hypothetical protein VNO80_33118 [Phaseolus coccineus]|uniref:Uncharacterized protein n=1 Tax=Phaseolus coccineus TaxID=3886 RepID=A0AAN9QCL9_PHACN